MQSTQLILQLLNLILHLLIVFIETPDLLAFPRHTESTELGNARAALALVLVAYELAEHGRRRLAVEARSSVPVVRHVKPAGVDLRGGQIMFQVKGGPDVLRCCDVLRCLVTRLLHHLWNRLDGVISLKAWQVPPLALNLSLGRSLWRDERI